MELRSTNYPFLVCLLAYLYYINFINFKVKLLVLFIGWVTTGGGYILYLTYHTLGRDFRLLIRGIPILLSLVRIKRRHMTVPKVFRENMLQRPDKIMFFDSDSHLTFRGVEELSNRVGNLLLSHGFIKGDTIALLMENRIEYIPIWIGMAKEFIHLFCALSPKFQLECSAAILDISSELKTKDGFKVYCFDGSPATDNNWIDMKKDLEKSSCEPEHKEIADSIKFNDPLLYIYTSGTTGLPKAVVIKHFRQLFVMVAAHKAIGLSSDDVIYCHLPLYHSSGGQIATGSAVMYGTKTFIKKKFSASAFWKDCVTYNITATQYIGEICRYLLASPSHPEEKLHQVSRMFGNGLRPQIWEEFVSRFNIKNISEFYGATEGNSNVVNNENKVGAVGFVGVIEPRWLQEILLPLMIIKVDPVSGEPIRDQDGCCIRCKPGEAGEFVGKIVKGDPIKEFNGYKSKSDTEKKILRNVVRRGDMYFRSGDIMCMDEFGWIYFMDRAGDTFRWKGENVSTAEVEVTVSKLLDGLAVVAYGVQIPGLEGRAGMVCIQAESSSIDLEKMILELSNQLPSYARPIFYRFSQDLDITGTYKLKKVKLCEEGFNICCVSDPILFLDRNLKLHTLNQDIYNSIIDGTIKL
ncbi:long-chain fatty acid transport protein 4 [Eurytemora carolleeae]|uniref:long-chain fatty acid transport protein 4 n=1 Tax=Eurytemora carolleeae TaxID=1294199 RepID=UPI000C784379|nr:long-chain fatty acid transport protein 4 [Eurytemora carolleeae]|eukprot:XP_023345858.1 long-chain fatty acid transport protein 4-like [Eurytemora affinis]